MTSKLYDPRSARLGDGMDAESIVDVATRIREIEKAITEQNGALDEAFEQLRAFGDCTFGMPNSDMEEVERACAPRRSLTAVVPIGKKC